MTYTYDNSGNRLTKVTNTGTTNYVWDEDSRMTVAKPAGGTPVTMTYNAEGKRARKGDRSKKRGQAPLLLTFALTQRIVPPCRGRRWLRPASNEIGNKRAYPGTCYFSACRALGNSEAARHPLWPLSISVFLPAAGRPQFDLFDKNPRTSFRFGASTIRADSVQPSPRRRRNVAGVT